MKNAADFIPKKQSLLIKTLLGASLLSGLLLCIEASAGPAVATKRPAADADKVDVSDLEKKYWATKDTEFNVVQNRLYSKAGRFAVSGFYGNLVNDPWSDGQAFGGSLSYFTSDHFGLELSYDYIDARDNKASKRLITKGAYPDNNKLRDYFGVSAAWVPFYAKMSVLGTSIIYFDMQLSLGGGIQSYQQQRDDGNSQRSTPALSFDITQHFFLSKYFAIRLDLKNRWYRDEVLFYNSTSVVPGGTRTISNDVGNTTLLMAGLTFLF